MALLDQRPFDVRLLGLFSAAVACVGGLLIAVLWMAAVHADASTGVHDESVVNIAVTGMTRRLETAIAPRVTGDEAVENLDNSFDHGWAAANLGTAAHQALGVSLTAVLDADGKVIYALKNGREVAAEDLAEYAQATAPLVQAVRRAERRRGPLIPAASGQILIAPIQFSASEVVHGDPYMLSATLVQPDLGRALPKGERAPVVIVGRAYDADYLRALSERYLLDDLRISPGDAPQSNDRARVVMRDARQNPVATLHWKPNRPGRSFFYKAAPAAFIMIFGLAGCLFLALSRSYAATRRLLRSEARLKLAMQAAEAGAFEIDRGVHSVWCSPEMEAILGHKMTYAEAIQIPWPFVHPEDAARVRREDPKVKASSQVDEIRIVRPDGEIRWVRLAVRWGSAPKRTRTTGLLLDIDERKRQELALVEAEQAAQAAAEAKSRFLATVSHEIRTPMNGVLGVLHLLKAQTLTADGAQLLDEALACGQMLTDLIDDVLDFSKIEAGELELNPMPIDPAAALDGVVKLLRPQCQAKGVYLEATIDKSVGWVSADPIRLRQALFNLIGNAVKFTTVGGVHVRMMWADEGMLRFEVADTGVGIPAAVQDAVFEQFHQGDSSTTREFGGTGLGLAITRRLARLMGGDVNFASDQGKGSTFWLELAAPAVEAAPIAEEETVPLPALRVLVVEDNATNRLVATRLLESMGMSVQTAEDGEEGVEAARRGAFDLILMDVQMPRMDGIEATRCIRALNGSVSRIPIIALTANAMTHQRDSYVKAGMNGLVAKPIAPAALMAEIARLSGAETTPAAALAS